MSEAGSEAPTGTEAGATAPDTGAAPAEPTANTAPAAPTLDSIIPSDLKEDTGLWSKFKTPEDAMRSLAHAQKHIGMDITRIAEMPDPAADNYAEQQMGILRKLGASDKVDDYTLTKPEGVVDIFGPDSEMATWLRNKSATLGLLPNQAQELYSDFVTVLNDAQKTDIEAQAENSAQANEELKSKLGETYNDTMRASGTALSMLGEDFGAKITEAGLQFDETVVKALAKIGGMLDEAPPPVLNGAPSDGKMTTQELEDKAAKLTSEAIDAMNAGRAEESSRLSRQAMDLRARKNRAIG